MLKIGVLGATGFTGEKLVEILAGHKEVEISYLCSRIQDPVPYGEYFPRFKNIVDIPLEHMDVEKAAQMCDLLFLSLPHTVSMEKAAYLLEKGKKVIDLSADYRIKDPAVYEKYYGTTHLDQKNLDKAVYGLPEFFKPEIKSADLIANPGCYPTSIELALLPLLKENMIDKEIIADAISAISGAGRKPKLEYHFQNVSNNAWAYKPFVHQHLPEMSYVLETVSGRPAELVFVPHVAGIETGIISTIHVKLKPQSKEEQIRSVYAQYYEDCFFVRVKEHLPCLKEVANTNFCDIGFALSPCKKKAVIVSCIDNLVKGAAGQAVQNMNLICGFKETEGLI